MAGRLPGGRAAAWWQAGCWRCRCQELSEAGLREGPAVGWEDGTGAGARGEESIVTTGCVGGGVYREGGGSVAMSRGFE